MRCTLKVLSPIHIGARQLGALDFVSTASYVYIISMEKLARVLKGKGLFDSFIRWSTELDSDRTGGVLRNFLDMYGPVNDEFLKAISERQVPIKEPISVPRQTNILEHMTDCVSRLQIIPGSSIKGAIRNALISNRVQANQNLLRHTQQELRRARRSDRSCIGDRVTGQVLLGDLHREASQASHRDWFRCLKISDAYPKENVKAAILPARVFSLSRYGLEPKPFTIWIECVLPGSVFEFDMSVDKDCLKLFKENPPFSDVSDILSESQRHTEAIAQEDSAFVYGARMPRMAAHFDEMGQKANLRLGWGGGWLSTSIGVSLLREDREQVRQVFYQRRQGVPFPKHRRFVVDSAIRPEASFGWARISI